MTDDMTPPASEGSAGATDGQAAGGSSESTSHTYWDEPEAGASGQGKEWMSQLQTMIEQVATQAAPVMREVGAKAAELAAVAGEKAGPVAHRAAALTQEAGLRLAERSRGVAAELRREQAAHGEAPAGADTSSSTPKPDDNP